MVVAMKDKIIQTESNYMYNGMSLVTTFMLRM